MKLPDLSEQARPIPQAQGGVARYQVEDAASAAAPGQAIAALGDQVRVLAENELKKVDTLRAEDAFNQLRQRQQDLTMGEGGFTKAQGGAAITQPLLKNYSTQFEDAANQIAETLGTPQQKAMFRERANIAGLQFRDDVMRHVLREGQVYQDQMYKGAVATETTNVSQHWDQPDAVALSTTRISALVDQQAEAKGWSPEFKKAVLQQELGNLHETVVDQALADKNYVFAEKWFDDHKSEMDTQTLDRLAGKVAHGVQKQLTNDYSTRFLEARDNPKQLEALNKSIAGDGNLDDDRKNMLLGRVQSRQEILANRAERASAARDRQLQTSINAVNSLTLQGFEPSTEQMQPLIDATRGTPYEPVVKQMIRMADTTRQFRNATPLQQDQFLTRMEAAARQDPTKVDVQMLTHFRTIRDNQQTLLKSDPTSFAVRQGLVGQDDPAAAPVDLSKPDTAAVGLKARFDLARSMQARYGAPFKPLTEAEAGIITTSLAGATAQQKRDFISKLYTASGQDNAGYTALMSQIAPDDPVTAIAGLRSVKDAAAADLLLQGQQVLRPNRKADGTPEHGKLWPMPKEKDFDVQFSNAERDAFAEHPQARNAYYQATQAIYAGLSAKEGDASGIISSDRFKRAFNMATGGVEKVNGRGVVLPYGMSKSDFVDSLENRIDVLVSSSRTPEGLKAADLKDLPLMTMGEGKYVLRSGDGIVMDRSGKKPLLLDFSQPPVPESDLVKKIPR